MKFLSKKLSLQVRLVILKAGRVSGPAIVEEASEIGSDSLLLQSQIVMCIKCNLFFLFYKGRSV